MICLYYFKNNYGDDLSPYLLSKLSDESIKFCKPFSVKRLILDLMIMGRNLLFFKGFHNFSLSYSITSPLLLSVGSIIRLAGKNCCVCGSGINYKDDAVDISAKIKAVRGPLTLKILEESGYPDIQNIAERDPALLLPLVYTPSIAKKYKIGIIAHNNDFNHIRNMLGTSKQESDILLISLKTKHKSVEEITNEICSCQMILSTSLHGLIVPHAYGIPALRIDSSRIHVDGVKFMDYFLSVGIQQYEPVSQDALKFDSPDSLSWLFSERSQYVRPTADISKIQTALLKAAPFSLNKKFASFCKTSAGKREK